MQLSHFWGRVGQRVQKLLLMISEGLDLLEEHFLLQDLAEIGLKVFVMLYENWRLVRGVLVTS